MKKTLILLSISVLLGSLIGGYINSKYSKTLTVMANSGMAFFLQEGVYANKELMTENTKELNPKIVVEENGKYYVYVGITRNEQVMEKLFNIYKDKGYTIYTKEVSIKSDEFLNNLEQFDSLIKSSKKSDEILRVEEVVLANYEEIKSKSK